MPQALKRLWRRLPDWLHVLIPGLIVAAAVGAKVVEIAQRRPPPLVEALQLKYFDELQRRRPRAYDPELPVRIIDVDDASLARLGQWPWPRTLTARLVRRLSEMGAAVVAFDVVFAEPDRTSPRRWVELLPDTPAGRELKRGALGLPDHDEALAKAFRDSGKVVAGYVLVGEKNGGRPSSTGRIQGLSCDWGEVLETGYAGAVPNIPVLSRAAAGEGNFSLGFEADGVIRRVPLIALLGEEPVPLLALEALRVSHETPTVAVRCSGHSGALDWTGVKGVDKMRLQASDCPYCTIDTDEKGRVWLHYTRLEDDAKRFIPAWETLDEGFDPSRVAGKILFIGTSAPGLRDIRSTPINAQAAGVEVHAQIVEQVLTSGFLKRPYTAPLLELAYLALFGLALIVLMPRLGAAWCAAAAIAATGGVFWLCGRQFAEKHLIYDPLTPSLTILLVYLSASLIGYMRTEADRRKIRGQFAQYMSPELVEQLARHPERLQLGGEMREMTLMFSDIRGFTTISEQFDAHGLTQFINRYLTPMTDIVLTRGGFIDKYMGDAIMAFWNAPLDDPLHAINACITALAMSRRLEALNAEWQKEAEAEGRKYIPIHAGIGLNTGRCCVGNMGSNQKFGYSVLGDDVNLASRLEGQSKNYGVNIIVGENTRKQAPQFAAVELDRIQVKGKTVPVTIYALLGDEAETYQDGYKQLNERNEAFLAAYRGKRWGEAERLAQECRAMRGDLHKLYDLHLHRIDEYRRNPPPLDWNGAYTATEK